MKYNFDIPVDRKNTCSIKWDRYCDGTVDHDVLPMWVADMDFRVPQPVIDTLIEKVQHGIYGYTERSESYYQAIIDWEKRRHDWEIKKEWLYFSPGTVPALHCLAKIFAQTGDKIIVQSPVYYPFFDAIERSGCIVVNNPLQLTNGQYCMDLEDLEKKIDERVKMLFLCSPHNPGGILWSREYLLRVGELCSKAGVVVVSDEIHADMILYGKKHVPFASLNEECAMISVICTAPSKTFNMAGLQVSNVIIPNPEMAKEYKLALERQAVSEPNLFAMFAAETAYNYGDEWLDQLTAYVEKNHQLVESFIEENIPAVKVIKPQATYLTWLDCRQLGMDTAELENFIKCRAGLGLSQGYIFGQGGEGFVRMNLGCPRSTVQEALTRLRKAVNTLSDNP